MAATTERRLATLRDEVTGEDRKLVGQRERATAEEARLQGLRASIAQAQQGKNADAKANFAQVSGERVPVAAMWQAYVDSNA